LASDPALDAWKGASEFGQVASPSAYITQADYQECGADYFAEHCTSNRRYAMNKR
jgi:actin-related protein